MEKRSVDERENIVHDRKKLKWVREIDVWGTVKEVLGKGGGEYVRVAGVLGQQGRGVSGHGPRARGVVEHRV